MDGRANGASIADEAYENETEIQSPFSSHEEIDDHDPENGSSAGGENCSEPGSYRESVTEVGAGSSSDVNGDNRAPKRPRKLFALVKNDTCKKLFALVYSCS